MKEYDESTLVPLHAVAEEMMQDPEFAAAYEAIQLRKRMVAQLKEHRKAESLTQEDIARRTGLKKQNISRLENGIVSPSLTTLSRYAVALGGTFDFRKLS